jgi:hypothetical protein
MGDPGFTSGFAATPVVPDPTPGSNVVMDPIKVLGKGPFTVRREDAPAGTIPSMVVRFRFTDRGTLTKAVLDAQVHKFLKNAGFKVSVASSLKPVPVTWKWEHEPQADFFFPVVSQPAALTGMRYSGNAIVLPAHSRDPEAMKRLPKEIWVYTMAVTSAHDTMTDGDAAQVVTLLKQSMVSMVPHNAYSHVELTLRGCPASVFGAPKHKLPPVLKAGTSALLLLVAYNMLAPHIGSEVL